MLQINLANKEIFKRTNWQNFEQNSDTIFIDYNLSIFQCQ